MNGMTGILRGPRRVALAVIALVLAAASAVALGESYRGLYDWAHGHALPGAWAAVWPLMVDTFLVVGELALFVALVDRWSARARIPAWAITVAGLAVSVAGNIGHVAGHDFWIRATAAVPPLAAAAALAVGLGVLKRVVEAHHQTAEMTRQEAVTDEPAPDAQTDAQPEPVPDAPTAPVPDAQPSPAPARQPSTRKGVTGRDKVKRILTAHPDMPRAEVARKAGVSESTVDRVKRDTNGRVLAGFNGHAGG